MMIKLTAKKRLAIFLSCGWILLFVIYSISRASDGFPWAAEFLGFGISPIFIIWGIYWVISGFKQNKPDNSKSAPLQTTASNEVQKIQTQEDYKKPKLLNQEEHEKPKFQNREEYGKWKAEKIRSLEAKQNNYDKCGYNCDQPNLDLIRSIKRKNIFYICIMGLGVISIGTIILVPATEAFFRDIAEILGALTGTYFLTRVINSKAKKRTSPTKAALIAFFAAAALCLIITAFTMGVGKGFIYIPYLVLWLIVDLVRAKNLSQEDRPSP